jgi:rRNA processing protein Gar1
VQYGDLVRSSRLNSIGVVVEVFGDLDPGNPWVRVMFTHPKQGYQWCKMTTLQRIDKKEGDQIFDPPLADAISGSGSL